MTEARDRAKVRATLVIASALLLAVAIGIPPGQEALMTEMLGGPENLTGGCRFGGATIGPTQVTARYACAGGVTAVLVLHHESVAEPGEVRTRTFALAPLGSAPHGLVEAVAARVAAREGLWRWRAGAAPARAAGSWIGRMKSRLEPLRRLGLPWVGPWMIGVALLLVASGYWRRTPSRTDVAAAAALGVVGLGLRLGLGVWGPHHVNGQAALWVAAALGRADVIGTYGPGYVELLGPIARLSSRAPDSAVFFANAALGALVPVVAYLVGRASGFCPRRALLGGALLAVDPVAIRFAATESYFPVILLLASAAGAGFAHAAARAVARDGWRAAAWGIAAALFAAQAIRVHPVASVAAALAPAGAMAAVAPTVGARLRNGAAAYALAGLAVLIVSGSFILLGLDARVLTAPWPRGLPVAGVLLVGVGSIGVFLSRPRVLALLGALHLGAALATRHLYAQNMASYDRLYSVWIVLALVALVPTRALEGRLGLSLAAAAVLALLLSGLPLLRARTTEQLEYAWLRDRLGRLPPGCWVAFVDRAGERVMSVPAYRVPGLSDRSANMLDASNPEHVANMRAGGACVAYVRTSLCATVDGRARCAATERSLALDAFATTTLPAWPSDDSLPYDRDRVQIGLARLR